MASDRLVIGNHTYSSWSFRGWLAVRRAGLNVPLLRIPLDTPEFAERIAGHSPTRQVPVLHHEGRVIWDSLAIVEYCHEQGAALWPQDADTRALARCVAAEMHSGFAALRAQLPFNCRAQRRRVTPDAACNDDIARVVDIWTQCRERATDGPWLLGEFSGADVMYAPVALRFSTYGIELPDVARRYVDTVRNDPLVREWVALARQETEVIEAEER